MCDPVTIAVTGATILATNEQSKMMQRAENERASIEAMQAEAQIRELQTKKRVERLKAKQEERERLSLLNESLSTITASGRGLQSASLNNIKAQNVMAYDLDIGTSRFNQSIFESQIAQQISVISQSQTPSQAGAIKRMGMFQMAGQLGKGIQQGRALKKPPGDKPSVGPSNNPTFSSSGGYVG